MKYLVVLLLFIGLASSTTIILNDTNLGNVGDSYVHLTSPNTNYGTSGYALVETLTSNNARTFLLFNTSIVGIIPTGASVDAELCLYMGSAPSSGRTYNAYNTSLTNSSGTAWTETNLRWNTQPSEDTLQQGISTGTTSSVWLCWNITNAFNIAIAQANQNMSIMIRDQTENSGTGYVTAFSSKENATTTNRPQLTVTWTYPVTPEPATGLVGYWKFDEDTGTYAYDYSNYNNTGTLYNVPTWATGKNYQTPSALSYNGINQYVNGTFSPVTNPLNFTVSAWIKTSSAIPGSIFGLHNTTVDWVVYTSTAANLLTVWNGTADVYIGSAIPANTWTHITIAYNGTHISGYVNGVFVSSAAIASSLLQTPASPTFYIGTYYASSTYFNGTIDEVKIWNRALSASEILNESFHFCPLNPLLIAVYNESSSLLITPNNFVFSNSTTTLTYNSFSNNFTDYNCPSNFPTGSSTISVGNTLSYSPRYYYSTLAYGGSYGLAAYLLPLSDLYEISTTIVVSNGLGGVVPGAIVSIYKDFGSGNTIVAQDTADGVGQTKFNLDYQTNYLLIANATGYAQISFNFQPSQPVYTITLQNTNASTSLFNCSTCGVTWNMTPMGYLVTGVVNFNYSIYDSYNDLNWWGMNVSYNGTSQYFTNQTTSSGGFVNYTMNTSNVLGNGINVTIFFYRNGTFFDPTYQYTGYSFTAGNSSLVNALAAVGASGLSPLTKGIIELVFITCFAGYVGTAISFGGGVIIEMIGLWFFASLGYMGFFPLLTLTILGCAIVYNRLFALTPAG